MEAHDLFLCCRKGDLSRVQYLVEQREVELNLRDKWDSTPLYYACLCGHGDLVKYLLEHGAKCEVNTFDGERCLYGALNNEIRNLLKNYKAITSSTMRRDLYAEFLRRLLDRGGYDDITFVIHGERFIAHRCILATRSEYFADLLSTRWRDRSMVTLSHKMLKPWAFRCMLQYLYTARLEIPIDQIEDLIRLARHCQLDSLRQQLEERVKRVLSFESTKPGVNVTVLSLEPAVGDTSLNDELGALADQALPIGFCSQEGIELPFLPEEIVNYTDVIFEVDNHQFQCHKAFFCSRSDYFKALVEDHFGEASIDESGTLPVVKVQDLAAPIFAQVINYIYQDSCELTAQNIFEVLYASDLYLLPGLKRQCSNVLGQFIELTNVVQMLRTARLFSLARLEDQCAEFIASNLDYVLKSDEFGQFVKEDASTVQSREETDTISIIDDIRFHITNFVQTFSDMYEADQKLALIDAFLEEQGLDA